MTFRDDPLNPSPRRLYKQDIAGSIAHATMLEKAGLMTAADRDAIVEGLRGIGRDIEAGTFVFDESLEDIRMVYDVLAERLKGGRKTERDEKD